ncbi:MAG: GNAT family N-acetyltransferase [Candidatus Methylacidiphilales bacterium]|nr:GNAT family N-acetyltransferase [Candidatus Methylacidiphilales bacterium]
MIDIRIYQRGDHTSVAEIFTRAIHEIACVKYTAAQCHAWSDPEPNPAYWQKRCELKRPFIAAIEGQIAGFLELDPDGHIDCAYAHPEFVRRGVMTALVRHAVQTCRDMNRRRVYVEASLCIKPLMDKLGFTVIRENMVHMNGQELINYHMELPLTSPAPQAPYIA